MDITPQNRRANGIDEFMLAKAAQELLRDMERNHWNKGEVEKFPQVLEEAIKKNSERIHAEEPFTLAEYKIDIYSKKRKKENEQCYWL